MEIWKDIVGYEGWYQVSNMGRFKRIRNRSGKIIERYLHPWGNGYKEIELSRGTDKTRKQFMAHRLVLEAFIGPCPKGMETNHKNGIRHDNRLENLEWITHSMNVLHSVRVLGNKPPKIPNKCKPYGENIGTSKLTVAQVLEIRRLWASGYTQTELGKMFDISISNIHSIVHRKTWNQVKSPGSF